MTLSEAGKWISPDKLTDGRKETLLSELPFVVKLPDFKNAVLAISKQQVHVVNTAEKKEFLILQQRAQSEHDCIENAFLTHIKVKETNVEGEKDKFQLHYFEKLFDTKEKKLKRCTYNTFDLTDDFIFMLKNCGIVIPSEKTKLQQKIEKFKSQNKVKIESTDGLSSEIQTAIREEEAKIEKTNIELKDKFTEFNEKVTKCLEKAKERRNDTKLKDETLKKLAELNREMDEIIQDLRKTADEADFNEA